MNPMTREEIVTFAENFSRLSPEEKLADLVTRGTLHGEYGTELDEYDLPLRDLLVERVTVPAFPLELISFRVPADQGECVAYLHHTDQGLILHFSNYAGLTEVGLIVKALVNMLIKFTVGVSFEPACDYDTQPPRIDAQGFPRWEEDEAEAAGDGSPA